MLSALVCSSVPRAQGAESTSPIQTAAPDPERTGDILSRFIECNRIWLIAPPSEVRQYSYVLNRIGGTQEFTVENPAKASRSRRQGVTYSSLLHQLAAQPDCVTVRSLTEAKGRLRLTLSFDPPVRGACGNGVENTWYGYFNLGGDEAYVILDAARLVPLEAGMGKLTETFAEFVAVDPSHFVPLAVTIRKEDMYFEWRFRLYEPGLWLFDDSQYGARRVAWVDRVKVNEDVALLRRALPESIAREEAEAAGTHALQSFLNANQQWLMPSLQARRGLIYDYRQETPYLERIFFDHDGNAMVRLQSTEENPDAPTRQKLWLADGRWTAGRYGDRFAILESPGSSNEKERVNEPARLDRQRQNLAIGLGWDCALTRVAREPDSFWTEILPSDTTGQYQLVLHARKDARLFAGTMLAFTSWAYMHDVRFDRSEILCDETTHRPLVERDYAGKEDLKGEFHFEEWIDDPSGPAPGCVRALIPYDKDGKDQSLEMEARFHFARPGVWLLEEVRSHFRGTGGGSTGTVSVASVGTGSFSPITDLIATATTTKNILQTIQSGPAGRIETKVPGEDWKVLTLKAVWTDEARESASAGQQQARPEPLIGIYRARLEPRQEPTTQLRLDGVSTAFWQEFETEWKAEWRGASGQLLGTSKTNLIIRTEHGPAPFVVALREPTSDQLGQLKGTLISVEATVRRMTGAYHGHGLWYRFARED